MFNGCSSLVKLNLTNFHTTNINNMKGLFSGCSSLISIDATNLILLKL